MPPTQPFAGKQTLYHLMGWAIFIVYEVSFVSIIRGSGLQVPLWSGYLVPYLFNIGLFYCHSIWVLPVSLRAKRFRGGLLILLLLLELCVYLLLMGLKDSEAGANGFFLNLYASKLSFIQHLWRGIYFLIFGTAFWMIRRTFLKEQKLKEAETGELLRQREKQELEIRLISTQNAFLQAQINPHLLFNTLNFIHSEVQQVSPTASEAIITLADMMRYSLSENKVNGKAKLDEEVEQIENLIRINQFRFNNRLFISFDKEGSFEGALIVPLLLIPFAENIFKYAELTDAEHPALISIGLKDGQLHFFTRNKKRKTVHVSSWGIGLTNVRTRLETHYAGRYRLNIKDTENVFTVDLTIEI